MRETHGALQMTNLNIGHVAYVCEGLHPGHKPSWLVFLRIRLTGQMGDGWFSFAYSGMDPLLLFLRSAIRLQRGPFGRTN